MGITSKSLDVIPEKWVKFRRYSFRRYSLDVIPAPTGEALNERIINTHSLHLNNSGQQKHNYEHSLAQSQWRQHTKG